MSELTPNDFRRIEALFEELDNLDPDQRADRLDELRAAEPRVAEELILLLGDRTSRRALADELDGVAEEARAVRDGSSTRAPSRRSHPADSSADDNGFIGPYRLISLLGRGGMGEVWEAVQTEPIDRRVAVKVVADRRGGETAKRFLAERQALATMDHPNIASVYDAGQTKDGTPYLVMELVQEAVPLNEYCRRNQLTIDERVELFAKVCDAIAHAHRKRLIHRDLKPSNVLVTEVDGEPIPKVIDFGIAKAFRLDPQDRIDHEHAATKRGELIGTPQYMSPEQADMGATDIDTRSDVYTLGVLLYELLVGELPMVVQASGESYGEVLRRIREEATPKPSMRLRDLAKSADRVATSTSTWRQLQGDLDRILGKALAKDREQRYGSATELADDLRRYLRNEPIRAMPPSRRYQVSKFLRRHRASAAFALLALLSLVVALVGTSLGLVRARAAEQRALAAEASARLESETAVAVAQFLEELLEEGNPERAQGATSFRELLEIGERKLRTDLSDDPVLRSRLLLTVGRAFKAVGDYDQALTLYGESEQLRTERFGAESGEVERVLSARSDALQYAGKLDQALETAQRQLEVAKSVYPEGDARRSDAYLQLAMVQWRQGKYDEAFSNLEHARDLLLAVDVTAESAESAGQSGTQLPHRELLPRILNNLGILHYQQGRYAEATDAYQRALDIQRDDLGHRHPHVASSLNNLGLTYEQVGDQEAALAAHTEALSIRREAFEAPHPDIAESLNNRSLILGNLERSGEAIADAREGLEMREELLEEPNALIATSRFNLGRFLVKEDAAEARRLLQRSLDDFRAALGNEHLYLTYPLSELGRLNRIEGRYDVAVQNAREALSIVEDALPETHPRRREMQKLLLEALNAQDRAETLAERERLDREMKQAGD